MTSIEALRKAVEAWLGARGASTVGCHLCNRTWERGEKPEHEESCPVPVALEAVARVETLALEELERYAEPRED